MDGVELGIIAVYCYKDLKINAIQVRTFIAILGELVSTHKCKKVVWGGEKPSLHDGGLE